jgi:hypothetical protein
MEIHETWLVNGAMKPPLRSRNLIIFLTSGQLEETDDLFLNESTSSKPLRSW